MPSANLIHVQNGYNTNTIFESRVTFCILLSLCDSVIIGKMLLKLIALPSGGCVVSLLCLYYTLLLRLSGGSKHLSG